jgi:hypothetical protein
MYFNNLGSMMLRLWETSGADQNISAGLRYLRAACNSAVDTDPGLPMYLHNLSAALASAWMDGDTNSLIEATAAARSAVGATPNEHSDRLAHMANLAALLIQTSRRSERDLTSLLEAVDILRPLVPNEREAEPRTFPVLLQYGEATVLLGKAIDDRKLIDEGRSVLRQAAHIVGSRPHHRVQVARRWGWEAASAGQLEEASEAYSMVVHLLAQLPTDRMLRADQEHSLRRFQGLTSEAAAMIIQAGDEAAALSALEEGRGVQLDLLRERRPTVALRLEELRRLMDAVELDPFVTRPSVETAASVIERASSRCS